MVETDDIAVLGMLSSASARITEGEVKQMTMVHPQIVLIDYLDVIHGKTAIYLPLLLPLALKSQAGRKTLINAIMGCLLGCQIVDDALLIACDDHGQKFW